MKRFAIAACAVVAAGLLVPSSALAQDPSSVYVQVDYMRVPLGMEAEYIAVERDIWKPVHEARQRMGHVLDWGAYQVLYAVPGAPYDYVTVNVYSGSAQMDSDGWEAAMQEAHPDGDPDELTERTRAARQVVGSEVWALLSSVQPNDVVRPTGQYLAFNYMDVPTGAGGEYVATERGVWAPIHTARTRSGLMNGWALYSLVLPRGEMLNYNYATIDFFEDMNDVLANITWDMMSQAHGGISRERVDQMTERTEEARSIYKTELWSRIESLDRPPAVATALDE